MVNRSFKCLAWLALQLQLFLVNKYIVVNYLIPQKQMIDIISSYNFGCENVVFKPAEISHQFYFETKTSPSQSRELDRVLFSVTTIHIILLSELETRNH